MTLKQVEQTSGLSATHLSEIERGRTSPTIGALVRIARALQRDTSYFIEFDERDDVAHQLRERAPRFAPAPGVSAESLSPGVPGSGLYAYRVHFERGRGASVNLPAQDLPGDTIYHVQSGRLTATMGDSELTASAGDTLQASHALAHDVRAADDTAAEVLVLTTRSWEEAR